MSGAHDDLSPRRAQSAVQGRAQQVLIAEPDEDVRELVVEHCRRLGLEPLAAGLDRQGRLPDADLIIAEPASPEGQAILAAHRAQASATPIVFMSVYPPASGVLKSAAVAYLVMPCSWEQFARTVLKALPRRAGGRPSRAAERR